MKLLLDTHVLIWAAEDSIRLPRELRASLSDERNSLYFSAASIWEITIKRGLNKADFHVDPRQLRRGLLDNGYEELPVSSEHAIAVEHLPPVHKDPFDRLLIAQAMVEGMSFQTVDETLRGYSEFVSMNLAVGLGS